jgi:hypothetical protein
VAEAVVLALLFFIKSPTTVFQAKTHVIFNALPTATILRHFISCYQQAADFFAYYKLSGKRRFYLCLPPKKSSIRTAAAD